MDYPGLTALIMAACLAASFLFSGMEAGVFALSRLRIRQMMRKGHARAAVLHGYLEQPENFLWAILIGNTLANFIIVSLSVIALHHWLETYPVAFFAAFVVAVFLFYALFDLLPKMLFQQFPNRLCLFAVTPFRLLHWLLTPAVAILTRLTNRLLRWTGGQVFTGHLFGNRAELRSLMQDSAQTLSTAEHQLINRVLDLQNTTLRHITHPWTKVVTVTSKTPMTEVLQLCRDRQLTRLPVWHEQGGRRRVVGVVSLKHLLYQAESAPDRTAGQSLQPALYLNENLRLEDALKRMQRSGQRLAIVLGNANEELGIVTLQDILRAIFGEVNL